MDIKKIKAIVDMIKESGIAELEITEGEEKLRVTCVSQNAAQVHYAAPVAAPVSAPVAVPVAAPVIVPGGPAEKPSVAVPDVK